MDNSMQALLFWQMVKNEVTWPLWMLLIWLSRTWYSFHQLHEWLCLFSTLNVHNKHLMIFSILSWSMRLCPWSWSCRQRYQQILKCFYWAKEHQRFFLTPIEKCPIASVWILKHKDGRSLLITADQKVQDWKTNLEEFFQPINILSCWRTTVFLWLIHEIQTALDSVE